MCPKQTSNHFILITLIIIIGLLTHSTYTQSYNNYVYSIHNVKYFRNDRISQTQGCQSKVAYGYFQYPQGALDALHIITQPGRYALGQHCRNPQMFAHVFGSNQNYDTLLQQDSAVVAGKIKSILGRFGSKNVIINWNQLFPDKFEKVHNFLNDVIKKLQIQGFIVYLKAPASFFCFQRSKTRYILGVQAKNFIIEMYGQNSDAYTNYEQIFTNPDTQTKFKTNGFYPQAGCSQYPSLAMLKNFDGNFFVGATLEREQPGYHGHNLDSYLSKAKSDGIYSGYVFYDHHPYNIIPV